MPNSHPFVTAVNILLEKLDAESSINTGIDLANEILSLLGFADKKSAEEVFESSIELPNAERYDSWFQPHPIFKSDRACFDLADANLFQAKFYWLKKHSRQIVAGGVHFTPNFEDEDFTHNDRYKVGIDFFLSPNGKSLQIVLSNRGNLRIVELNKRLNSTQVDIFTKWEGAGNLSTQEALHTTLWESFKLKSVNQKFYDGVSNSFTELLQHLKSIDKEEEEAKLFASRLLGRLLFCWFLRKKGIIDEDAGYFNASGLNATTYYKQSLERLFFSTLNTPIDDRDELTKQHQKSLFPAAVLVDQPSLFRTDEKTPYLNGGLFEPHENDWYKESSLTLPDGFFTGLYDHFDEFNFTTDESSPEYEQVAIDPEMLGRVFESLLATQMDETGQQARKAKGAFYTPREIVSYMCKESLRNYLYEATGNKDDIKSSIDSLLDISDSEWAKSKSNTLRDKVKDNRTRIIDALDVVTILDPACGSGAFPMGMLQLMLKTYERLESRFDPYKTKLSVIQNNIFGVDIEPMAVEISRLRAWLSLIVDEDDPRSVDPLPNLDFKFVCANSLLPLDKEMGLFSDNSLHEKLKDIRTKYFNARKKHTKKALRDEYYSLTSSEQTSLITEDNRTKQLKSFDPFMNSKPAGFFDADHMFGIQNGFAIVIGNPPYVSTEKLAEPEKSQYKTVYESVHSSRIDLYVYFIDRGIELLNSNTGTLSYITSNKWMLATYGKFIRNKLSKVDILQIIDFGSSHVFEGVTVDTNILLLRNRSVGKPSFKAVNFSQDYKSNIPIDEYFENESTYQDSVSGEPWILGNNEMRDIKEKIEKSGTELAKWDIKLNYGIKTGCNDAFIIDSETRMMLILKDPKSEDIIKPILRGRDIKKFSYKYNDLYLLAVGYGDYKDLDKCYPAIYDYLVQFKEVLESRGQSKGSRSGKQSNPDFPGQHHWLELDNNPSKDYFKLIDGEKISWGNLALHTQFSLVPQGYAVSAPGNFIVSNNCYYLLGVLNSKLAEYYIKLLGITRNGGYFEFQPRLVKKLPVPPITASNDELVKNIEVCVKLLLDDPHNEQQLTILNSHIYKLYELSDEAISVIEKAIS
jgi:type I restriction-modification system DNA methylase subunit